MYAALVTRPCCPRVEAMCAGILTVAARLIDLFVTKLYWTGTRLTRGRNWLTYKPLELGPATT